MSIFLPSSSHISTTVWLHCLEKKLERHYTRMLHVVLNKSWKMHLTKQQFYSPLPPILQTIPVRRARQTGYCWGNNDELIRDIPQWTPTHRHTSFGWQVKTYIHYLCADTECYREDLPKVMVDRDGWWERIKGICDDDDDDAYTHPHTNAPIIL